MVMPQMGESVMEGTILKWYKNPGDEIEEDDSLLEVATDKVDTDIPSAYTGKIIEVYANEGDVIQIGKPICKIELSSDADIPSTPEPETPAVVTEQKSAKPTTVAAKSSSTEKSDLLLEEAIPGRFYSPLVLNIARKEGVSMEILERIKGSGKEGRVTKKDILTFLEHKETLLAPKEKVKSVPEPVVEKPTAPAPSVSVKETKKDAPSEEEKALGETEAAPHISGDYEIVEMDRMRKIIADRMLESKKTSAHVTSFVEADVTNLVYWKNRRKQHFMDVESVALTLTPLCVEAVAKAIKDYPKMNASVSGDKIYIKKDINIGIAVALPSGNLIVPVIKNADQLNMVGLTKRINDLVKRARSNKLKPADLEGGTFTVSNMGSFGNIMGTPILVQPQIGILALGAVVKKPTVIETPYGDTIGIRHKMILSHSYDHRVVDGALGGMFVRRVADYMEKFDLNREI